MNKEDDPTSAHLAALEDDEWKILRTKLTPIFTSGKLKGMFPILNEVADLMVKVVSSQSMAGEFIDMKDISAGYSIDVIAKIAFGIESNSLVDKNSDFFRMGQENFGDVNVWKEYMTTNFPNLSRRLHIPAINVKVAEYFRSITKQKIDMRRELNIERNDVLSLLMKMIDDSMLTFDEVAAQTFVFFVAGYETSASTIAFCIYQLSLHKDIQEKLRESVRLVLESHEGNCSYEAIAEMQYLEQCVKGGNKQYFSQLLSLTFTFSFPQRHFVFTLQLLAVDESPKKTIKFRILKSQSKKELHS